MPAVLAPPALTTPGDPGWDEARRAWNPAVDQHPAAAVAAAPVVIDVIHLGPPAEADALVAPLRACGPVTDTIAVIPARALSHVHLDPEQPTAGVGDGLLLASLPAEAIETLIRVAGTGPRLSVVELRHLGGEMKRARPANGTLAASIPMT